MYIYTHAQQNEYNILKNLYLYILVFYFTTRFARIASYESRQAVVASANPNTNNTELNSEYVNNTNSTDTETKRRKAVSFGSRSLVGGGGMFGRSWGKHAGPMCLRISRHSIFPFFPTACISRRRVFTYITNLFLFYSFQFQFGLVDSTVVEVCR